MTVAERRHQQQQDFLARLRRAVRDSGLQGKELAKRLGVAPSSVTGWLKHGALPGADVLIDLPYVLGVSADYLLAGRGNGKPGKPAHGPTEEAEGALTVLGEVEIAISEIRRRWEGKRAGETKALAARTAREASDADAQVRKAAPRRRQGGQGA